MKPINPDDPNSELRATVQAEVGYIPEVAAFFDNTARQLLHEFIIERRGSRPRAAYAGVNHNDPELEQFFVGMAVWDEDGSITIPPPDSPLRRMSKEKGFCNYGLAERDLPLPLNDLLSSPRFASNPVVDLINARAYLGDWITVPEGFVANSGYTVPRPVKIGSVWVVDTQEQDWNRDNVGRIKAVAAKVTGYILERHRQQA